MNDHRWSLEHLPWYLNGTLVGEEQARVQRHLASCTVCQREYTSLQRISDCVNENAIVGDNAPQALALLQDKLCEETGLFASLQTRFVRVLSQTPPVIRYAVALQALLLVAASSWMLMQSDSTGPVTGYQTLSQEAYAIGDVRLIFSEDSTADQQSALLNQFGLISVARPTKRGVLTLRWSEPDAHLSLHELRAQKIVQFAEPLQREAPVVP